MLAWAALLTALAVMLALWTSDLVAAVLLPSAVVIVLLVAVAATRADDRDERVLPEASVSAILGAAGLAMLAVGAAAGLWAALIGAGLVLVAIVAAVRERWG
jgi:uncharacterized membrane protein